MTDEASEGSRSLPYPKTKPFEPYIATLAGFYKLNEIIARFCVQVFCTVALDSLQSALKLDPMSAITGGVKASCFFGAWTACKLISN
jgi:hypothetical protein